MTANPPITGLPEKSLRRVRLPSLTGLRFPAAFAVFLFHSSLQIPANTVFADKDVANLYQQLVSQSGATGVTFFFVLSGFVLTWSRRENDRPAAFWRRRLVKIYPNHVATALLAFALFAWAYTTPWQGVANLLLLQTWIPDYDTYLSVDPPSWSLSVEIFFYLVFPVVYTLMRRIRPERLYHWAIGLVLGIAAVAALSAILLPSSPQPPDHLPLSTWQYWANYIFPPGRLLDFALGIVVGRIVLSGRWIGLGVLPALGLFVASYGLSLFVPYLFGMRSVCAGPIALLIGAVATSDVRGTQSLLRHRAMVWLGEVSFAFYLVHAIVLVTGRQILGDRYFATPVALSVMVLYLVISVLLAWALYRWVEKPTTSRWSRPRSDRTANPEGTHAAGSAPLPVGGGT